MRRYSHIASVFLTGLLTLTALSGSASAANVGDLEIRPENFRLSDPTVVHFQVVKVYATVNNNSNQDLLGSVQFRNITTGNPIGGDQPISVVAGGTDTVFVDWAPPAGNYTLTATIIPWVDTGDDPQNNQTSFSVNVDYDFDTDGIGNSQDPDDDNDGTPDKDDDFPFNKDETTDTDNDGEGDNADTDDDGDNVEDILDDFPLDPTETVDTDGDGQGDNADPDDDNDGLTDEEELSLGTSTNNESTSILQPPTEGGTVGGGTVTTTQTDPKNPDTDGDGHLDGADDFPLNSTEWIDTDGDQIGNNEDPDDENDGVPDVEDEFPLNQGPVIVLNEKEIIDENGVRKIFLDASGSFDPDGKQLRYQWFTRKGGIISESAVLELDEKLQDALPANLFVFDEKGESRSERINLGATQYGTPIRIAIFSLLLLLLALLIYLKYAARDSKSDKPVK